MLTRTFLRVSGVALALFCLMITAHAGVTLKFYSAACRTNIGAPVDLSSACSQNCLGLAGVGSCQLNPTTSCKGGFRPNGFENYLSVYSDTECTRPTDTVPGTTKGNQLSMSPTACVQGGNGEQWLAPYCTAAGSPMLLRAQVRTYA